MHTAAEHDCFKLALFFGGRTSSGDVHLLASAIASRWASAPLDFGPQEKPRQG